MFGVSSPKYLQTGENTKHSNNINDINNINDPNHTKDNLKEQLKEKNINDMTPEEIFMDIDQKNSLPSSLPTPPLPPKRPPHISTTFPPPVANEEFKLTLSPLSPLSPQSFPAAGILSLPGYIYKDKLGQLYILSCPYNSNYCQRFYLLQSVCPEAAFQLQSKLRPTPMDYNYFVQSCFQKLTWMYRDNSMDQIAVVEFIEYVKSQMQFHGIYIIGEYLRRYDPYQQAEVPFFKEFTSSD